MEWGADRLNRAVMQLYKRGEGKRHYHENKAVDLQVELHSYPHLWSRTVESERKIDVSNMRTRLL